MAELRERMARELHAIYGARVFGGAIMEWADHRVTPFHERYTDAADRVIALMEETGEPVAWAWQRQNDDDGEWYTTGDISTVSSPPLPDPDPDTGEPRWREIPLYAHPEKQEPAEEGVKRGWALDHEFYDPDDPWVTVYRSRTHPYIAHLPDEHESVVPVTVRAVRTTGEHTE